MISVIRKTHMPSVELARCCSMSAKWCRRPCCAMAWLSDNGDLLAKTGVVVRVPGHDRRLRKILRRWRTWCPPLQPRRQVRIVLGCPAVAQRPQQVDQRQNVTHRQDRCARRGHHVQHLELIRVRVVPARHPEVPKYELREEGQVEA